MILWSIDGLFQRLKRGVCYSHISLKGVSSPATCAPVRRWNASPLPTLPRSNSFRSWSGCQLSSVVQWHRVRRKATVPAEMMTGPGNVSTWGGSMVSFNKSVYLRGCFKQQRFPFTSSCLSKTGWRGITIMMFADVCVLHMFLCYTDACLSTYLLV